MKCDKEVEKMPNPWEKISLDDYEKHMSLDSVRQLQTMNCMMHDQFASYPVSTAIVLGVAGGNGLEHISTDKYTTVYGIDINESYLSTVKERYGDIGGVLKLLKTDLINEADKLPCADLVIANLLVEYIGYEAFKNAVIKISPEYVSCVIQINTGDAGWVSDSPYLHSFDCLDEVHHQMDNSELTEAMNDIGYSCILQDRAELPNGKALVRLDFKK